MPNTIDSSPTAPPNKAALWGGRVLTGLIAVALLPSGIMKLTGGPEIVQGFAHLGLPADLMGRIAALELVCLLLYLVPHTAVLGAILITGYMGGAVCIHLRIGEPVVTQVLVGVIAWAGIWLREPRLRQVLPLRRV